MGPKLDKGDFVFIASNKESNQKQESVNKSDMEKELQQKEEELRTLELEERKQKIAEIDQKIKEKKQKLNEKQITSKKIDFIVKMLI